MLVYVYNAYLIYNILNRSHILQYYFLYKFLIILQYIKHNYTMYSVYYLSINNSIYNPS